MAEELPPGTPEVDDPILVADLIRLLSIKGAIGRLPLADVVIPVVSLGSVVTPTVAIRQPSFRSTDVFSAGIQLTAPVNTVHADTGPLQAGVYDMLLWISRGSGSTVGIQYNLEHRDAANAANLAIMSSLAESGAGFVAFQLSLAYEFALNERFRILNRLAQAAGNETYAVIFARLRT